MKKHSVSVFALVAAAILGASCQNALAPADDPAPAGVALSDLSIVDGDESVALSAEFAGGTVAYTARLPNSCENLRIYATPEDVNASVSVSVGAASVPLTVTTLLGSTDPIFTGTAGTAVGLNVITVVVTAADGADTKTYTIEATRVGLGLGSDTMLESLDVMVNGSPLLLAAEAGKGGRVSYSGSVADSVTSVVVMAAAMDSAALIYGAGSVNLVSGVNRIRVVVVAADGTAAYTFVFITRGPVATLADYVGTWSYADAEEGVEHTIVVGAGGGVEYTIAYDDFGGIYAGTLAVDAATGSATATSSIVRNYLAYSYDAATDTLGALDDNVYDRVGASTGSLVGDWSTPGGFYTLSFAVDGTLTYTSPSGSSSGTWDGARITISDDECAFNYTVCVSLSAPTSLIVQNGHQVTTLIKN